MTSPSRGRIVITCGPSYEPIDQVRRITNSSTGKLGITLANHLAAQGWKVLCLKGVGATCPEPLIPDIEAIAFATNADLIDRLTAIPGREAIRAVFHAAALCDFQVKSISTLGGEATSEAKISSRQGLLNLLLEPAPKVISGLRGLFPGSLIAGWKYELVGSRAQAIEKGERQIVENRIDACVVNGAAYGEGYGIVAGANEVLHVDGLASLCDWAGRRLEIAEMA